VGVVQWLRMYLEYLKCTILADFIQIRQIKSPPKLNKNNIFLDKSLFVRLLCFWGFDIIIDDED